MKTSALFHFSLFLFTFPAFTLQAEEPYEFRRRLETVHQAGRRDKAGRGGADSRLGWEPSMEYVGGPKQIRWKLQEMEELYGKDVSR